MVNETIKIFARVKPTKKKTGGYLIDEDSSGIPRLTFVVPKQSEDGLINNKKEQYKFRFEKVFDQNTLQDEIFDSVAKHVADNVLEGYNGTIFAYGQTGSGKTFTITGGPEKYADRGIIPRTLSYVFDTYEKTADREYTTQVSYLEIYNNSGYDLLDPKHEAAKLEDLPKVTLYEDSDQNIHLKNLSIHTAANEEEALNLLFMGDTNRMIAETPMNQASTRSHCIFTVHITSRVVGQATVRRSKLHLVDLAGSERVAKTGTMGVQLTEAKYINLSLHFLEQVIVSLSEKNRQHIPYRNSMMTSVLRDSLGGNCMTTMIATCSVEKPNMDESISTCRFAQRVALIKNDAILNEELDPKLMIGRLKREIEGLKEELAMATGEARTDKLTEEEMDKCRSAVESYVQDADLDSTLSVGGDMRKIQYCFQLLKTKLSERVERSPSGDDDDDQPHTGPNKPYSVYENHETEKLQQLVQQRDNEINILVGMLKKEKQRSAQAAASAPVNDATYRRPPTGEARPRGSSREGGDQAPQRLPRAPSPPDSAQQRRQQKILGDMSLGRQEAYELFKRDYNQNVSIDDNKTTLKARYAEAKSLGEQVNEARNQINHVKSLIEQHRMSLVMNGLVDPQTAQPDETEIRYRQELETHKETYKVVFARLRTMKTEIEHLQHLLEKQKVQMMKAFEIWWAEQSAQVEAQQKRLHGLPTSPAKKAWRTPPVTPPYDARPPSALSQTASESHESVQSQSYTLGQLRESRLAQGAPTGAPSRQPRPPSTGKTFVKPDDSESRTSSAQSQLTGDPDADADIMAFLKARKQLVQRMQVQKR